MQLTRFTDYSLRTLIFVGVFDDRLCTIPEIAHAYGLSENHLMKVVNELANRGYVTTVRGKGGGLKLARPANLINIGAVVRDMEDNFHVVECLDSRQRSCALLPSCTLRSVLDDATQRFLETLGRYTLADLLPAARPQAFALISGPVPSRARAASRTGAKSGG